MAVVIFDKEDQLQEPLLRDPNDRPQATPAATTAPTQQQQPSAPGYLQAPSAALHRNIQEIGDDSLSSLENRSRRSLNESLPMEDEKERDFGSGLVVELSKKTDSRRESTSSSLDEDEGESVHEGSGKFLSRIFTNHSASYKTLPRRYNPGTEFSYTLAAHFALLCCHKQTVLAKSACQKTIPVPVHL